MNWLQKKACNMKSNGFLQASRLHVFKKMQNRMSYNWHKQSLWRVIVTNSRLNSQHTCSYFKHIKATCGCIYWSIVFSTVLLNRHNCRSLLYQLQNCRSRHMVLISECSLDYDSFCMLSFRRAKLKSVQTAIWIRAPNRAVTGSVNHAWVYRRPLSFTVFLAVK